HDGQGEVAQVNGFRRGMLAKVIVGPGLLSAGRVLRCCGPGCAGEIGLDDHCGHCYQLSQIEGDPRWWLWLTGQRQQWPSWRCNACDCLYFQHAGPCPHCGAQVWNPVPYQVWIPVGHVSLNHPHPDTGASPPELEDQGPSPQEELIDHE